MPLQADGTVAGAIDAWAKYTPTRECVDPTRRIHATTLLQIFRITCRAMSSIWSSDVTIYRSERKKSWQPTVAQFYALRSMECIAGPLLRSWSGLLANPNQFKWPSRRGIGQSTPIRLNFPRSKRLRHEVIRDARRRTGVPDLGGLF